MKKFFPRTWALVFAAGACFQAPHQGSIVKDKNRTNVLGGDLVSCSKKDSGASSTGPNTGYYRDGFCATGPEDSGVHVVCAEVTKEFLDFSKSKGNDLMTPMPESNFKGLKAGDRWCLCASRWKEAFLNNVAPPVVLEATHIKALAFVSLNDLQKNCR